MRSAARRLAKLPVIASAVMLSVAFTSPAHTADDAVVSTLLGNWRGTARISYTDGSSESIRCTGYYTGGGSELRIAIQCSGDSRAIHIRSKLRIEGSRASGDWEERTFNAGGNASGRV